MFVRFVIAGWLSATAVETNHSVENQNHSAAERVLFGFELQDNHHSSSNCNAVLLDWFQEEYGKVESTTEILDVGGGHGGLGDQVKAVAVPDALDWECIDVAESVRCAAFDGESLPHDSDSKDIVIFNYVLHHAADNTIPLLQHARRIARKYVVVVEDLKGENIDHAQQNFDHEWHGTFRGPKEWRSLFSLVGLRLVHEANPKPLCSPVGFHVDRAVYVLEPIKDVTA